MPLPLQERQKCSLLTESILLREMAEELRRDRKQQGVPSEGVVSVGGGGGNFQTQEDKEHNIPFRDVLK